MLKAEAPKIQGIIKKDFSMIGKLADSTGSCDFGNVVRPVGLYDWK